MAGHALRFSRHYCCQAGAGAMPLCFFILWQPALGMLLIFAHVLRQGLYLFCLLDIYPWGAARYTLMFVEQGSGWCVPLLLAVRVTFSQCSFVAAKAKLWITCYHSKDRYA